MASSLSFVDKVRDKEEGVSDTAMGENSPNDMALVEESEGDSTTLPLSKTSQYQKTDLSWPGLGTLQRKEETNLENQERQERMCGAMRTILECVGEDPDREGLRNTPTRYAKAMLDLTEGYQRNVHDIVSGAMFSEEYEEMVIVRDIEFSSLCEHHLLPFFGKVHIGYIPRGQSVVGLSKLARVVEIFSRRLQVQERLAKQIASALDKVLEPEGVAVVVEASHLCLAMRGVQKTGANTITSCMLGCFRSTASKSRDEFLNFVGRK